MSTVTIVTGDEYAAALVRHPAPPEGEGWHRGTTPRAGTGEVSVSDCAPSPGIQPVSPQEAP